ncbi:uncharacterized protein LOC132920291 [Rhopalosiphum padi]|uniref:uncharacterized protein LOC132920291 n=1 Tax=Rhopalosiphum padi TaxID=40932 RepID=UPI00298DBF26|nr:uncharacterized protein LOC132920291 [Rhopalosiphum padi]XP_060838538.1 uncharacterized protein LOC132920291 [Rhopalosiphum padi]XP_060838539.1 uncharacterized protein LOC132920291 [Rhopalosiphum padi]XP_060838540.1 uncharacterized protein LOC132920291 [Rhopalosiphum padi]
MEADKISILEKLVSALELKVYGTNKDIPTSLPNGNLLEEVKQVDNNIGNACIGHPYATALLSHVKLLDKLMDPFYEDYQTELSKREVILSAESEIVKYAQQLQQLNEKWPALNDKYYSEIDKHTEEIEKLVENEQKQHELIKEQTEHINTLLFRYEQVMLKFSVAFDTLEKEITVLEYKTSKKPEEDNEDDK